jgi:DNA repair ATPase RecN
MTKLIGLKVENYKAISLFEAEFSPDGGVVALMGKNGAGKSAVLDALESLIAGRRMPKAVQPVKAGAHEARVAHGTHNAARRSVCSEGHTFDQLVTRRSGPHAGEKTRRCGMCNRNKVAAIRARRAA